MKIYIILIILSLGGWVGAHAQTPQKLSYTYDALNRLTEVTYPNGSKVTYNYDVLGNRTSVVTVGSTPTCAVPTGMQWSNTTATSFQPRCDGVAGYSYVFHYRVSGTTTWTETTAIPCTTTGVGTVQTVFTGLTNSVTYEWQVKTVCSIGNESAYSASTFSSTFCQPANLNTPSGSQITSTTVYLAWNNFGIPLNVNLRWRVVGASLWNTANNLSGTNNTLTGLLPSSNYEVQIQTICADGSLSSFSSSRTFTTLSNPCPSTLSYGTGILPAGNYQAGQTINSSSNISSPTTFKAGNSILLSAGFSAGPNENFEAMIQGCVPTSGLVSQYLLNGNSSDAVGSNVGTISGNVIPSINRAGLSGNAMKFGGVSNVGVISIPNSSSLQFATGFSISIWYKIPSYYGMDGYGQPVTNGYQVMMGKEGDRSGFYIGVSNNTTTNKQRLNFTNNVSSTNNFDVSTELSGTASENLNKWIHLVVVASSTQAKIYTDGVLRNTANVASVNYTGMNSQNLYIGTMRALNSYWYPFGGDLDDIRIYNRALTDSEVLQINNAERP